jgi:hypothetical protein
MSTIISPIHIAKPEHPKAYFAVGRLAVCYIDIAGVRHTVVWITPVYRNRWMQAQYGPNWRKQSNRNARLAKRQEVLRWGVGRG